MNKRFRNIETDRLLLRAWEPDDADALILLAGQEHIEYWLPDWREYDKHAKGWIQWALRNYEIDNPMEQFISWAITLKDSGKLIGQIAIGCFDKLGEKEIGFGYFMDGSHTRQGYMTEAVGAVSRFAFDVYGYGHVIATIEPENYPSRGVAKKAGFQYIKTIEFLENGHTEVAPFRYYRLERPERQSQPEEMSAFFNARAHEYNSHILSPGDGQYRQLVCGIPPVNEPLHVLDIGCGTGIELDYIWGKIPNAHVTCVDLSRGMLDLLLENHSGKHSQITVIEASYLDWDYPENAFDLVVSNQTMHHFLSEKKTEIYRQIVRTLKPGGSYLEGDFMVDTVRAEEYRRRYDTILANLPQEAHPGEYHIDIPFTVETQERLLLGAGFQNVEVLVSDIKADWSYAVLMAVTTN